MNTNIQRVSSKVKFGNLLALLLAICALAIKPVIADDEFAPTSLCPDPELAVTGNLSTGSEDGKGSEYLICPPGELLPVLNACAVLFAHGTVDAVEVVNGEIEPVIGGKLKNIEGQLNEDLIKLAAPCAFAVVSRQETGAFVEEKCSQDGQNCELVAIQELRELVSIIKNQLGVSEDDIDVFGSGASLGGLLMTLAQERTVLFDGAIAACGPYILENQVNFQHDAIVVFDYLFDIQKCDGSSELTLFEDAIIPTIPSEVILDWNECSISDQEPIESQIRTALKERWDNETREFLRVLSLDESLEQATEKKLENFDDEERDIVAREIRDLFEDGVFNGKDFQQKLCRGDSGECLNTGNVYANENRVYSGSDNDEALNDGVQRFRDSFIDQDALIIFNDRYKVSGELQSRTTTLHGIGETRVPYERNAIPYELRVLSSGSEELHKIKPVKEIEHCKFEPAVAYLALLDLRLRAASFP